MIIVFLLIGGLSILFTIIVLAGWKKISVQEKVKDYIPTRRISVIIPLRNEGVNIKNLLRDLDNQIIRKELFEVLLIDDQSSDDTVNIARKICEDLQIKVIIELNNGEGKKEAIETGIRIASGEIIVTTDGDCRVGPNWLTTVSSFMDKKQAVMITGPVRFFRSGKIWDKGLMMESAALQGVGAVSLSMGNPTMCNGANLGYLRQAFIDADGYEGNRHIPSGDDEFLMHKLSVKYPGGIHYLKSSDAVVETKSSSGKEWINQRRRWASKWKGYSIWSPKLIALCILIFNLNLVYGLILILAGELQLSVFIELLIIKILVDYMLVYSVEKFLERQPGLLIFSILELLYPLYVICFGFLGLFGNYTWKGRKSNPKG